MLIPITKLSHLLNDICNGFHLLLSAISSSNNGHFVCLKSAHVIVLIKFLLL